MADNRKRRRADPDRRPPIPGDDDRGMLSETGGVVEGDRHYLRDPDGLSENARDEDERATDDLLEVDQTELEELGLLLDDPHQPEQ